MDDNGHELPDGELGELVTRGPYTIRGYYRAEEHNKSAFTADGFYRTGDMVRLHADGPLQGNLSVEGRKKDLINRGGEKISPLEIDEILLDHPAVRQVVCFGIPHEKLGEEVGAAVVLREGHSASEKELRDHVASRVADFKVPRKILLLDEIPKGATGKLQRIGMAQKLGLA